MIGLALALAAALAEPANPDYDAGSAAFADGRYHEAARKFERAYEHDPQPLVLYAWAQAERLAERCDRAVPLYRQYLELDPSDDDVATVREAIEACGEDPDVVPEPPPDGEGSDDGGEGLPSEEQLEPIVEQPAERTPRPVARDVWGHALTWTGVAVAGVGGGLLGAAHRRRSMGDQAADEQGYRDALEGAPPLSRAGVALLGAGGALVVAGVVRFAVVAARSPRADATALRWTGTGLAFDFELAPRRPGALR